MGTTTFVTAAAVLALERVAYIWIYRRPDTFVRLLARWPRRQLSPVDALARVFAGFKIVQVFVFAWWLWRADARLPVAGEQAVAVTLGLLCVAGGQFLNLRVFQVLGRAGVFYGNRFGLALPWRNEFPFSVMDHPQYVGTCLSIWGLFMVTLYPQPGWYALPLLETAYYAMGSFFER